NRGPSAERPGSLNQDERHGPDVLQRDGNRFLARLFLFALLDQGGDAFVRFECHGSPLLVAGRCPSCAVSRNTLSAPAAVPLELVFLATDVPEGAAGGTVHPPGLPNLPNVPWRSWRGCRWEGGGGVANAGQGGGDRRSGAG